MDCSPSGSSVHGIFQARILECVAICYSRGSSQPREQTHISCLLPWQADSLPLEPPGKASYCLSVSLKKEKITITKSWKALLKVISHQHRTTKRLGPNCRTRTLFFPPNLAPCEQGSWIIHCKNCKARALKKEFLQSENLETLFCKLYILPVKWHGNVWK